MRREGLRRSRLILPGPRLLIDQGALVAVAIGPPDVADIMEPANLNNIAETVKLRAQIAEPRVAQVVVPTAAAAPVALDVHECAVEG